MHLDCRKFPTNYTFAQQAGDALGLYVKVAGFSEHKGQRIFRMIIDPEVSKEQLAELLISTVKDEKRTYEFAYLETVPGPIVDDTKHVGASTNYLRVTFL